MCRYIKQYHKGCWHKVLIVTETNRCQEARRNGFDCPKTEDTVCLESETDGICDICGGLRVEMERQRLEVEREAVIEEGRGIRMEAKSKGTEERTGLTKKKKWRRWFERWKPREEVRDVVDDLYVKLGSVRLGLPQRQRPSTW